MNAYQNCKFCLGRGCLACDGEREKDRELATEPLFVADPNDPCDMALLENAIGAEAIDRAYGPDGRGAKELWTNLIVAAMIKAERRGDKSMEETE